MATDTAFAQRFVLENKWAALGGVALKTGFVLSEKGDAATPDRLRQTGPAAFDCAAGVRIVTIGATHFPFEHRMAVRQLESRAHFEVALETSGG